MAGQNSHRLLIWVLLAAVVSQTLVTQVVCSHSLQGLGEQKNYYPPDPHGHGRSHSHGKPACPTPSTPSHGGSGSYGTPTSHGGGGSYGTPTPSHGGGGYYTPPSGVSPPTPVVDPGTPATPTTPLVPPTPYTPDVPTPPTPLIPDPNTVPPFFTGTCDYWKTHPKVIWKLLGYWGTLGGLLGGTAGTPAASLNIMDALRNTRADGMGALYREGTAAFLNSVVNHRFVFTPQQVRDAFTAALATEQAAANQAQVFQSANEGHLKH